MSDTHGGSLDYPDDDVCPTCGGSGFIPDTCTCCDDTCCCLVPEEEECDMCGDTR